MCRPYVLILPIHNITYATVGVTGATSQALPDRCQWCLASEYSNHHGTLRCPAPFNYTATLRAWQVAVELLQPIGTKQYT